MVPLDTTEIGHTNVRVTRLGFGGAPIGGDRAEVTEEDAISAIEHALELGITFFDTAPLYGHGKSERFYGLSLAQIPRENFVLSTKVGRVLNPVNSLSDMATSSFINPDPFTPVYDYSRDGVMRSLEESLKRLKLDRIDIAMIHDPDEFDSARPGGNFGEPVHYSTAINEAFPALADLRSDGVIKAIGVGMNQWQALTRFAKDADFDCFLLAGRYTLLDQSALNKLLPLCTEKQISVVLGGPYNSGILASDLSLGAQYFYTNASQEVLKRAREINTICERYDVPIKAAALQFGLAHPAVAATIPGSRNQSEVRDNFVMANFQIPNGMWQEIRHEGLIPSDAPTPNTVS
ncbi:MAG: aldo/keto reductase [SAR202 cluster bacterium]|nr:aldo/keto reductase [SAR202 cluster bacterium]